MLGHGAGIGYGPRPPDGPHCQFQSGEGVGYVSFGFNMMLIPIESSVFFAEVTFTFYIKSKNKGQNFVLCNKVTFWGVTFTL